MPFVNIKVTGGAEAPTAEQKQEIIKGPQSFCNGC